MHFLKNYLKSAGKVTQLLLLVIALDILCAAAFTIIGSKPNGFSQVKWFAYTKPYQNDSWEAMTKALIHVQENPEDYLYQALLIEEGVKFQYPPSSLLLFDIPERIFGLEYYQIARIWDILSFFSILVTAFFISKILTLILTKHRFEQFRISTTPKIIHQYILVLAISVFFYPLMRSYHLGQMQTILTLLATMSIYYWLSDKKITSGVLIGLICLVKPQLGLLFVWGLIRKQWAMVIAGGITILSVLLVSIALYGFHNHLDYLSALSYLSKHGESYYPNQSVNGLVNRLLFNGENLYFHDDTFPPFSQTVYLFTSISSLILIFLGLLWNYKSKNPNVIDLSIMILCTTMASPIAWEHHYGILLPIFVLLLPFAYYYYSPQKWKLAVFIIAFIVASQYLGITKHLANSYFNVFQSYLLFAALLILLYSLMISRKMKTIGLPNVEN